MCNDLKNAALRVDLQSTVVAFHALLDILEAIAMHLASNTIQMVGYKRILDFKKEHVVVEL